MYCPKKIDNISVLTLLPGYWQVLIIQIGTGQKLTLYPKRHYITSFDHIGGRQGSYILSLRDDKLKLRIWLEHVHIHCLPIFLSKENFPFVLSPFPLI